MEGGVSGFPGMIVLNSLNYFDRKIKVEDLSIVKDLYETNVDMNILYHVANDTND